MKVVNLPTYEEYIYRYKSYVSVGENRYYEFCRKACGIIKRYLKTVDKYCTDSDFLMDIVYKIYEHQYVSKKEY